MLSESKRRKQKFQIRVVRTYRSSRYTGQGEQHQDNDDLHCSFIKRKKKKEYNNKMSLGKEKEKYI